MYFKTQMYITDNNNKETWLFKQNTLKSGVTQGNLGI